MTDYRHKNAASLAYDANKKRLRLEGRLVLDLLMNEALHAMTQEFNEALNRGEVLELEGTREEMLQYLRVAAQQQLGVGNAD